MAIGSRLKPGKKASIKKNFLEEEEKTFV